MRLDKLNSAALTAGNGANPGWLLAYGLDARHVDPKSAAAKEKNRQPKAELIKLVAEASEPSEIYCKAYERWRTIVSDNSRYAICEGALENRLLMGMGMSGPLETNITLSRPYGMPLIPGSSLKGAALAMAARAGVADDVRRIVFGSPAPGDGAGQDDAGEEAGLVAGYLVFHDAWWIPDGNKTHALMPEVTTPHHPEYYQNKQDEATDFDSPNPVPQIAAQGQFLFVVEGVAAWAEFGMAILRDALKDRGIGAARSAGYGYFTELIKK